MELDARILRVQRHGVTYEILGTGLEPELCVDLPHLRRVEVYACSGFGWDASASTRACVLLSPRGVRLR